MNNYDLHERAQELADTHSAYELAKMVVMRGPDEYRSERKFMNKTDFFNEIREAAKADGAIIIETGNDLAVDLRGLNCDKPVVVLCGRPNARVCTRGATVAAIAVVGWMNNDYGPSYVTVDHHSLMPSIREVIGAPMERRKPPLVVGPGLFLDAKGMDVKLPRNAGPSSTACDDQFAADPNGG